ncbi:hypothetical protein IW138_006579, partial [Coemansia sp. RSA 986]
KSSRVAGSANPGHQSNTTPHVQRSSHANSHTNSGVPMTSLQKERKSEAYKAAQETIMDQYVPDVATPRNENARLRANEISSTVAFALEKYIASNSPSTRSVTRKRADLEAKHRKDAGTAIDTGSFSNEYEAILEMAGGKGSAGTQRRGRGRGRGSGRGKGNAGTIREHAMYPWVKALFSFIADAIDKEDRNLSNSSTAARPLLRNIIPFNHADRMLEGADDRDRIDIGLTVKDDIAPGSPYRDSTMPDYSKMLALIEAKHSNTKQQQCDAYAQLFKYSRHIYVNQHDRRFVWGLTVCGSTFCICLLGYKRMVSSAPIDVATPDGRETLVKWLVNMSLCERDRLGYDPTLYFNREERRWEIEAYDDSTDAHKTFEIVSCMRISDRVCGRHTRCFRCKEIEASGDADEQGKPAEVREVLVKRAWAIGSQESGDKSRDEVSMLREINNTLKDNKDLEGKYPTLLAGGILKITDENGEDFDDTVDTAFAGLKTETLKDLGFRVQKSMAMTPIGQDIRRCKSADELIIAAADVME